MGQAKQRGTKEERVAIGIVKEQQREHDRNQRRLQHEASLTTEQKISIKNRALLMAAAVSISNIAK